MLGSAGTVRSPGTRSSLGPIFFIVAFTYFGGTTFFLALTKTPCLIILFRVVNAIFNLLFTRGELEKGKLYKASFNKAKCYWAGQYFLEQI